MKISNKTKWSYSVGCLGRDMMFVLVTMFVLNYIQYTIQLSVAQFAAISTIIVAARIFDAANDPLMGVIIENTHFKSGKFRPWILIGGVLNALVGFIMFTFRPTGWAFVWFFGVVYIAWGIAYTINDIAYWSLLPNLSSDNDERNQLTNLVLLFASLGQFLSGGLIPVIVTGNAVLMYRVVGSVIALIFLLFTLLTYFGVTENPRVDQRDTAVSLKQMLLMIWQNDQLMIMTIALLIYTIASQLFVAFALNFFYFEFGYGGGQITLFTVCFALGTLSALAVFSPLCKRYNRMTTVRIATVVALIGYAIFLALGYVMPMALPILYGSAFLVYFGQSLFFTTVVVMMANTIEYNEWLTGERNESIIFSVRPFMSKLGAALQQVIVTAVLIASGVYGYSQQIAALESAKIQDNLGDIAPAANRILASATDFMRLMIRLGMAFVPLLLLIVAYWIIVKKYNISEVRYDQLRAEIATRQHK